MKVGILTSSRADYGVYLPLLRKMSDDTFFEMEVIAFGTHLMEKFGRTGDLIYQDGFPVVEVSDTMSHGDLPADITQAMSKTMRAFSDFYNKYDYQLIIALGDRYEMFAAVSASVPFNIPIAHIHGGETTLGAIDNGFRHSITCFSKLHFTSTNLYKERVKEITGDSRNVYCVGALSIDNLNNLKLLEISEFKELYNIDLGRPTILFTFHPETVDFNKNEIYIKEVLNALEKLSDYQIIITMPNADTMGLMIRQELERFAENKPNIRCVETFGAPGYLSAMKHCSFMLGNTSSGFVEAAFFPKWVINLGDRQKGRILTKNILQTPVTTEGILRSVERVNNSTLPEDCNIYGDGNSAGKIISILKETFRLND